MKRENAVNTFFILPFSLILRFVWENACCGVLNAHVGKRKKRGKKKRRDAVHRYPVWDSTYFRNTISIN